MIENIAIDDCLSTLYSFTPGVHSNKNPWPLSDITSGLNFRRKYLAAWPHVLKEWKGMFKPDVKELFETSPPLIAPVIALQEVQLEVHSECTFKVH